MCPPASFINPQPNQSALRLEYLGWWLLVNRRLWDLPGLPSLHSERYQRVCFLEVSNQHHTMPSMLLELGCLSGFSACYKAIRLGQCGDTDQCAGTCIQLESRIPFISYQQTCYICTIHPAEGSWKQHLCCKPTSHITYQCLHATIYQRQCKAY